MARRRRPRAGPVPGTPTTTEPADADGVAAPRRSRRLVALLICALAVRLAMAWLERAAVPIVDEAAYHQVALSLVEGRGFSTRDGHLVNRGGGTPTSLWGCLHPLYVAAIYRMSWPAPVAVFVANALLGLVPVAIVFGMARRLGGERAATVAAGLIALDVYLVRYSASLLSETLYTALLALLLDRLARLARTPGSSAALVGLLAGLAALTRAQAFYLALAALVWLAMERRRDGRPFVRDVVVALLTLLATISPWVVRNARVHDRPVFLDTKAGWNLYAYLHPEFDPWTSVALPIPAVLHDPTRSESAANEELVAMALGQLRADPAAALAAAPTKLYLMWSPLPTPGTEPRARPIKLGYLLLLEGLALVGLIRSRLGAPEVRLIVGLIVATSLAHAVMLGGPRFRAPLDPGLAVLAGLAVTPRSSGRTRPGS